MKTELRAGNQIETLTKTELVEGLRDWMVQTVQGARPIDFSAQAAITAAGVLTLGGSDLTGITGPDPGFVWVVRRVVVQGLTVATDPTSLYKTEHVANKLVYPNLTGAAGATGYKSFNSGELVLHGDDKLIVYGTGIASTGTVTLTGAALCFPEHLAWRYLS